MLVGAFARFHPLISFSTELDLSSGLLSDRFVRRDTYSGRFLLFLLLFYLYFYFFVS